MFAWWTTRALPGWNSTALTNRPRPPGTGMTNERMVSAPSLGNAYGSGIVSTISGVPNSHSFAAVSARGRAAGSPSSAPFLTHCRMSATWASLSRRTSANAPCPGCGFQGGMYRVWVTLAIRAARGRASEKASSENGAPPPGLWQPAHFSCRIGATSRLNVTAREGARLEGSGERVGCGGCAYEAPLLNNAGKRPTSPAASLHFAILRTSAYSKSGTAAAARFPWECRASCRRPDSDSTQRWSSSN